MGEHEYHKQGRHFDHSTDALLRADIDAIRCNKELRIHERKRHVAKLVKDDLLVRGRFVCTQSSELFYFDRAKKTLESLDVEAFRATLYDRYGLNQTEEEARFVIADLLTFARTHGEQSHVHQVSHWDDSQHILYVSANDGTMFVLDGQTIERMDNGQCGVVFRSDRQVEPIAAEIPYDRWPDDRGMFHELFEGLHVAGSRRQTLALLKMWMIAIFFSELLPVRPLLLLLGDQGAGKTSTGRRIGIFIYGRHFQVGDFRSDAIGEQDFLAAVTRRAFLVFDNADAHLPWLADHLAKLSTGSEIERRKLYTTNDLITYRPDCFLMLTSRTTPWKRERDDVARRMLPIRMETITGANLPEGTLRRVLMNERPRIWGSFLMILNDIVAAIRQDSRTFMSHHRLADFHWFGRIAATVLGIKDDFEDAMMALHRTQFEFLAEGDDRLDLFMAWVDQKRVDEATPPISTRELFVELRKVFAGPERLFPFRSPSSFGTWIGRNKEVLMHVHGLAAEWDHGRQGNRWRFRRTNVSRVHRC